MSDFLSGLPYLGFALLYFLPTLIAERRKHPSAKAITFVNLVLGWTVLGWVAAMAWALADTGKTS
jgi:hypothetical protein